MIDLQKCTHELCDEGTDKQERTCYRCEGRGYMLPAEGFYIVRARSTVYAVEVASGELKFTGESWDLSEGSKVEWLYKVAERDGSPVASSAIVKLDTINRVLEPLGSLIIVHHWDGRGERDPVKDATKLELVTVDEWKRRTS